MAGNVLSEKKRLCTQPDQLSPYSCLLPSTAIPTIKLSSAEKKTGQEKSNVAH
jgi:hypothetical protein